MDNMLKEFNEIADRTLNKVFMLKNRTYRQIDIQDVDNLLSTDQMMLEKCKERVSKKCKEIGSSVWSKHTMFLHPLKGLNNELMGEFSTLRPTVSQAYIKFGELLETYPELTKPHESFSQHSFRSLHLCEAPGCFVQALADFLPEKLRSHWLWRANSLMPYNETAILEKMLIDDRFLAAYIDNFLAGPDTTGNLMTFTEDYISLFLGETGKFQLVTCDGSFDCTDNPGNQETSVYPLILQSWKISMKCLQVNGCAVIKIYTLFSQEMLNFMNQFCPMFERVYLHKPAASKPGNSEVYLIGIGFREAEVVDPIDNDLRLSVYEAARFFARHQIDTINFNLASFGKLTQSQRSAIEIKKYEIKAIVKSRLKFIATTVLNKRFLHTLEENNHWQKEAWYSMKFKVESYQEYRRMIYKRATILPIEFNPEWSLNLMSSFVITPETLNSIIRSKYVVLSLRSNRLNFPDSNRVTCSLFADYKLLDFAQDLNINFYDICCNKKFFQTTLSASTFRRLRYPFMLRDSELLVDGAFMGRADWLEMCYYTANRTISSKNIFPSSNLAILLPKRVSELCVDCIRVYTTPESSFILSRFAGSMIFFLSLFFEEISLNKSEFVFSKRRKISHELADYVRQLTSNIPSTQELVQFVPLRFFTNYSVYSKILAFNNQGLHDLLQKEEERQRHSTGE